MQTVTMALHIFFFMNHVIIFLQFIKIFFSYPICVFIFVFNFSLPVFSFERLSSWITIFLKDPYIK